MSRGSTAAGLLGGLCGVLLALLAIFIGSSIGNMEGGGHESAAPHHEAP